FLRFVDNERLLQLALLADAAEEAKALTRLTDRESCETEKVAQEVEAYLARITMLFIDRGCREFGYTNFMLRQLRNPMLVYADGQPKRIGGPLADGVLHRAFGRMACWVRLTHEVVRAEYPNFSIFTSFSVFHLPDDLPENPAGQLSGAVAEKLKRLAKFFHVNEPSLMKQFVDVQALAGRYKTMKGSTKDMETVVRKARLIWSKHFGVSRRANEDQIRYRKAGPVQTHRNNTQTEASWLRERRQQVAEACRRWRRRDSFEAARPRVDAISGPLWTPRMQKEATFQQGKRLKRLIIAHKNGMTLDGDVGNEDDFQAKLRKIEQNMRKNLRDHERKHELRTQVKIIKRPQFQRPRGVVFLDKFISRQDLPACRRALSAGARVSSNRARAGVFIVADIASPGQRVRWHLAIRGGAVMDPAWLKSQGRGGFMLKYKAATQVPRKVWVSAAWAERHEELFHILGRAAAARGSKWSLLQMSEAEILPAIARRNNTRPIHILLTPGDK
ncbi:nlaXM, partial [Symbiodinium pilosum]